MKNYSIDEGGIMRKKLVLTLGTLLSVAALAHAPLVSVDDNGDGTIYMEGGFSNGASAAGIPVIIVKDAPYNGPEETFKGKEILYEGKFGEDNSITLPKPATPKYEVYFNAGEGHIVGKKGPALTEAEQEAWKKAVDAFDFGDWKDYMLEK